MGARMSALGHFDIVPELNEWEQQYLAAFSETPAWARDGDPYGVADNPSTISFAHRLGRGKAEPSPSANSPLTTNSLAAL